MRIGLIIQNYRIKNKISMDIFAKKCDLSKAYIGMLEQGVHPKTKKPINPSVDTIKKVASGMGMDFEDLFKMLDEDITLDNEIKIPVDDPTITELKSLVESATPKQRESLLVIAKALLQQE